MTSATTVKNNPQRVSSISSLRMLCTVVKATSGRNSPTASSPVSAASFSARITRDWDARADGSAGISHLFDVRLAEKTLRQENQRDGQQGENGDILVVDREVG